MKKESLVGWWQQCGMMRWYPDENGEDKLQFTPNISRLKKTYFKL